MGTEESQEIQTIQISKDQLSQMNNTFKKYDTNNSKSLSRSDFEKMIFVEMPQLRDFSHVIFKVFSNKNVITTQEFLDFYNSALYLGKKDLDSKSLPMRLFDYLDKNNSGYLDKKEIKSLGKKIYGERPSYNKKFTFKDAKKLIESQKPKNEKKGLSKEEFLVFFNSFLENVIKSQQAAPPPIGETNIEHKIEKSTAAAISSLDCNISSSSNFSDSRNLSIQQNEIRRNRSITNPGTRPKIISESRRTKVDFSFDKEGKFNEEEIQKMRKDFSAEDKKSRDALDVNELAALISNQCLIPVRFTSIALHLFGKNSFINFDGYCALNYSLSLTDKNNKDIFARKVFESYDTNQKGYLDIKECMKFGNDITVNKSMNSKESWEDRTKECMKFENEKIANKSMNSKESWEDRINECKTIYKSKGICYEWFYEIMFNIS